MKVFRHEGYTTINICQTSPENGFYSLTLDSKVGRAVDEEAYLYDNNVKVSSTATMYPEAQKSFYLDLADGYTFDDVTVTYDGCGYCEKTGYVYEDSSILMFTVKNFTKDTTITIRRNLDAPTIETSGQPTDVTADAGKTATFSVTASGKELTYQWQIDNGSGYQDISGATEATYTTAALAASNNGAKYRCVVANDGGSVNSDAATLTVKSTDASADTTTDRTVAIGEGKLTVDAASSVSTIKKTSLATSAKDVLAILENTSYKLTDAERAAIEAGEKNAEIELSVTDNSATIASSSKNLIQEKADAESLALGQYLDITLTKYMVTDDVRDSGVKITSLGDSKVKIALTLTDELLNTDTTKTRTYYVLRNHDGSVTMLDATFDATTNTLTFETDRFSDYAIAYKDVAASSTQDTTTASGSTNTLTSSPKTGESTPIVWMFVGMMGAAIVTGATTVRRKRQ